MLLVLGMVDAGVAETRGLVFTESSLGSDLTLGRYLGKLVNLVVVFGFVDRAGIFTEQDRSEYLCGELILKNTLVLSL